MSVKVEDRRSERPEELLRPLLRSCVVLSGGDGGGGGRRRRPVLRSSSASGWAGSGYSHARGSVRQTMRSVTALQMLLIVVIVFGVFLVFPSGWGTDFPPPAPTAGDQRVAWGMHLLAVKGGRETVQSRWSTVTAHMAGHFVIHSISRGDWHARELIPTTRPILDSCCLPFFHITYLLLRRP